MRVLVLAALLALPVVAHADLTPLPVHPLRRAAADSLAVGLTDSTRAWHTPAAHRDSPENLAAAAAPRTRTELTVGGFCLLGLSLLQVLDAADIASANKDLPPSLRVGTTRPTLKAVFYGIAGVALLTVRF